MQIGLFLYPKSPINVYKKVYIDTFIIKSDHKPVIIEIDIRKIPKRGPSYWKLNNSLLKDVTYCDEIKQIIDNTWRSNLYMKLMSRYEFVKYEILRFSKQYAQKKKGKTTPEKRKFITETIERI